jgi:hypothetical protein
MFMNFINQSPTSNLNEVNQMITLFDETIQQKLNEDPMAPYKAETPFISDLS